MLISGLSSALSSLAPAPVERGSWGRGHRRRPPFGSRARGEGTEESDLDLIALVDTKTPELEQGIEDAVYGLMWDHDFKPIISLKIFEEIHFREAVRQGFSFYRNVEREGLRV
ncbi:MAG: nucleotidyltransferase domain-containing protein [Thermodesulfobacteriota bacterium]